MLLRISSKRTAFDIQVIKQTHALVTVYGHFDTVYILSSLCLQPEMVLNERSVPLED